MATAYDLLGIGPDASRADLEAAYRAQYAAYDPARVAHMGDDFVRLAGQRRRQLTAAYQDLRAALASPLSLTAEKERRRDYETLAVLIVLVVIALMIPVLRETAVPKRVVEAVGADVAAMQSNPAPNVRLEAMDGSMVNLSDYKGKVVLLNLWATWCPPCVRETPRLVRLSEQYKEQGLVVVGVNTITQDDRAKVAAFMRDNQIKYPVLLDTNKDFQDAYRAMLLPTSYLVDRDGRIVQVKVGEIDEAQFEAQIQILLESGGTDSASQ